MKKGKVLLITPNLKGIEDGVNRIQPSLGFLLIAPILEKNGFDVKIYDSALAGWENRKTLDEKNKIILIGQSDEKIAKEISDYSPDIVAISVLFSNLLESAHNIAKIVKRVNKDIVTILGGNHISSAVSDYQYSVLNKNSGLPNEIQDLENEHFDLAMIGEGEFSVLELCQKIMNKQDISKVPGLVKKLTKKNI